MTGTGISASTEVLSSNTGFRISFPAAFNRCQVPVVSCLFQVLITIPYLHPPTGCIREGRMLETELLSISLIFQDGDTEPPVSY